MSHSWLYTAKECTAGITLEIRVCQIGHDLLVTLTGGKAHIGAVVVAVPGNSLERPEEHGATASVIALAGHREDQVAKEAAIMIADSCSQVTTVVCGIHKANATQQDIGAICSAAQRMVEQFCTMRLQKP